MCQMLACLGSAIVLFFHYTRPIDKGRKYFWKRPYFKLQRQSTKNASIHIHIIKSIVLTDWVYNCTESCVYHISLGVVDHDCLSNLETQFHFEERISYIICFCNDLISLKTKKLLEICKPIVLGVHAGTY